MEKRNENELIIKDIENTMALEGFLMQDNDKVLIEDYLEHRITKEDAILKILNEFKGLS